MKLTQKGWIYFIKKKRSQFKESRIIEAIYLGQVGGENEHILRSTYFASCEPSPRTIFEDEIEWAIAVIENGPMVGENDYFLELKKLLK